jgi:hypothetical protein
MARTGPRSGVGRAGTRRFERTVNVTFVYIDGRIVELVSATDQLSTVGWTVLTALIVDAVKKALDRQDDEDRRDDE